MIIFFDMINKINMIFIFLAEAQSHRGNFKQRREFLGAPLSRAAQIHSAYSSGSSGVLPASFRSAHHLQPSSPSAPLRLCEKKFSFLSPPTGYFFLEPRHPAGIKHPQIRKIFIGMMNKIYMIFISTLKPPLSFVLHPFLKPHAEAQRRRENFKPRRLKRSRRFSWAPRRTLREKLFTAHCVLNTFPPLGAPLSCAASTHPASFRSAHHLQPSSPWDGMRPACILNHERHKKNPSAALRLCERQHLVTSPQSLIPASTHGGPK